ncbi:MAG: malonyl CoA-acyl carrier protein transacylase, partial [Verrucomicrobiota bacterium]
MEPTALLFSGQGAQRVGMGTDLAEASPAARKILELNNEILPADFLAVLQNGPEESLTRTSY